MKFQELWRQLSRIGANDDTRWARLAFMLGCKGLYKRQPANARDDGGTSRDALNNNLYYTYDEIIANAHKKVTDAQSYYFWADPDLLLFDSRDTSQTSSHDQVLTTRGREGGTGGREEGLAKGGAELDE